MNPPRVALVTGAGGGIGRETARELGRRGHTIAALDRDAPALAATAEAVRSDGGAVLEQVVDLSRLDDVRAAVEQVVARFGRLDVLVNNAAWRRLETMDETTVETWDATLRVCLTAPAFLARWAAADMALRGSGVIINVSSINSRFTAGLAAAYVAAKGGLNALTRELAALYGPRGVRVVTLHPGAIDTDLSKDYGANASGEPQSAPEGGELRRYSEDATPLGRWGRPEEMARTIAFLASDDASFITGSTLTADGGWSHSNLPLSLKRRIHPEQFR